MRLAPDVSAFPVTVDRDDSEGTFCPAGVEDSVARLGDLDVDGILAFHGGPVDATAADVRELHASLTG